MKPAHHYTVIIAPFGSQERSKPSVKVVASGVEPPVADIIIGVNEACSTFRNLWPYALLFNVLMTSVNCTDGMNIRLSIGIEKH